MCNKACLQFGKLHIKSEDVKGKRVIEIGSMNVNGSIREIVEGYGPLSYIGVDIHPGAGVDEICDAGDLLYRFGEESFDMVICTEVIEHIRNWKFAISNIKKILKPNGLLILTTRSAGCGYHGHPNDFWRYETDDVSTIFSDFMIENIEKDSLAPGVFISARKPSDFGEMDLSSLELYSIINKERCDDISELYLFYHRTIYSLKTLPRRLLSNLIPAPAKSRIRRLLQTYCEK